MRNARSKSAPLDDIVRRAGTYITCARNQIAGARRKIDSARAILDAARRPA